MQRLRIIAPLVISTLYNDLWSDSRSGNFTQLCTYTPHEQQVFSHPVIFNTLSVCFYAKQLTHFLLKKRFAELFGPPPTHSRMKPHSVCQALLLKELLHMSMSFVAEFSCCVPCSVPCCRELCHVATIYRSIPAYASHNRHTLSQDILLLKGTKHQLSEYGKMPLLYGFSKACVTFQFSFCPIRGQFEIYDKQDA